ncbi:MAG TPA: TauD/TfdA family dioxygenase [Allosphingosinicella sp.]|nr:TauD/TfdA family dioxygenase [Allosphingosinicella sp.]
MTLPHVVEPDGRGLEAAREELTRHGALLFRGWGVEELDAFQRFVDVLSDGAPPFGYAGGASPRQRLSDAGAVYSSTEYPPEMTLSLHNELSYADVWPTTLYFFCLVPAQSGGETSIADSRRILAALDPELVETFRRRRLRYVRNLSPVKGFGYSWQEAFETDDPAEAERGCARIGADFEWQEGGVLRVSQIRDATAVHPETGEEVWFNQADGFHPSALLPDVYAAALAEVGSEDRFRLNVTYGDGGAVERESLDHIRAVLAAETIPHRWQAGDVLVIDNLLTAHGRLPFAGPRKIALAMT